MAHAGGRPTKLTEDIIQKAQDYLYVNDRNESGQIEAGWKWDGSVIPTIESFASYLRINRDTIYEWAKINEEFSDIVREIKNQQASMLINGSLDNKYNATIAKLILSGKHGYVEKSEQDITTKGESINQVPEELVKDFTTYLKDKSKS